MGRDDGERDRTSNRAGRGKTSWRGAGSAPVSLLAHASCRWRRRRRRTSFFLARGFERPVGCDAGREIVRERVGAGDGLACRRRRTTRSALPAGRRADEETQATHRGGAATAVRSRGPRDVAEGPTGRRSVVRQEADVGSSAAVDRRGRPLRLVEGAEVEGDAGVATEEHGEEDLEARAWEEWRKWEVARARCEGSERGTMVGGGGGRGRRRQLLRGQHDAPKAGRCCFWMRPPQSGRALFARRASGVSQERGRWVAWALEGRSTTRCAPAFCDSPLGRTRSLVARSFAHPAPRTQPQSRMSIRHICTSGGEEGRLEMGWHARAAAADTGPVARV